MPPKPHDLRRMRRRAPRWAAAGSRRQPAETYRLRRRLVRPFKAAHQPRPAGRGKEPALLRPAGHRAAWGVAVY